MSAIADASAASTGRQPADCLTKVQGRAIDAPWRCGSGEEARQIHWMNTPVSDHNLRRAGLMSGIFNCACLANYGLKDLPWAGLGAINANIDIQRQFCA
jgi:hypothetical protein